MFRLGAKQCLDVGFTPPVQDWVLQILCLDVGFTPPEQLVLPKNVQIGCSELVLKCCWVM